MKSTEPMAEQAVRYLEAKPPGRLLDIGCGAGHQARRFLAAGWQVTGIDYKPARFEAPGYTHWQGSFLSVTRTDKDQFDAAFASHVLEHQQDIGAFLRRLRRIVKRGGTIAITVPPPKHNIVGGHVTIWTPGLLAYNMAVAGFNCRALKLLRHGYNITAILDPVRWFFPVLTHDHGDVNRLSHALPPPANEPDGFLREGFDGWNMVNTNKTRRIA